MRPPVAYVGRVGPIPEAVYAYGTVFNGTRGDISPSPLTSIVRYSGSVKNTLLPNGVTLPILATTYPELALNDWVSVHNAEPPLKAEYNRNVMENVPVCKFPELSFKIP